MTEKTYPLVEIEAAIMNQCPGEEYKGAYKGIVTGVKTELQKPKFTPAVGQVVFVAYLEDDQPTGEYIIWGRGFDEPTSRPLTQEEVGPDWVPATYLLSGENFTNANTVPIEEAKKLYGALKVAHTDFLDYGDPIPFPTGPKTRVKEALDNAPESLK